MYRDRIPLGYVQEDLDANPSDQNLILDIRFDDPLLKLIYIIWIAQKLKFQMFLSFLVGA